jgi:hypothetical protein
MQHELVILSSSPGQPPLEDESRDESSKEWSTSISYLGTIDKRLKSGSNASKTLEHAETDFRLASSLLANEDHERTMDDVLVIAAEDQEKSIATNSAAGTEEKQKKTRRKKDDSTTATGRKKKREADKPTTPDGGRARKNVRKAKATGRVSAYFGAGKDQESGGCKPVDKDAGFDITASPPPRRRISWTPPKSNHQSIAPDEALIQISELEYKNSQVKTSGTKQPALTVGRKIEVCQIPNYLSMVTDILEVY